jgi:hypothetical protein
VQQEKAVFSVGSHAAGSLPATDSITDPRPLGLWAVAFTGMPRMLAAAINRVMLATTSSNSSGGMAAARRSCASMMSNWQLSRWHRGS